MSSGTRKPHSKSRTGCIQCKRRRKKCDEKPPTCGSCRRLGITCEYTAISQAVERIANNTLGSVVFAEGCPPLPSLDQRDVKLLHFYASQTSFTISGWKTLSIWQSSAVEDSKSHLFLMHSLLALSALHGSSFQSERSRSFASTASQHHEKALAAFRSSVTEIKVENSRAIALFSLLTAVFSFGVPVINGFPSGASPTSMFLNVIGMLRKAWFALGPKIHEMEHGNLKPLIKPISLPPLPLGKSSTQLLHDLEHFIKTCDESQENKRAYHEAMNVLVDYFWSIPDSSPLSIILCWPLAFSEEFFGLLQEKRPFPLLCLAYFLTPVSQTPNLWLRAWAKPIITEIWEMLDESLRWLIEWPASRIGLLPFTAHASSCRCFDCYLEERSPEFAWKDGSAALLTTEVRR